MALKGFYASRDDVRKVVNDLNSAIGRIDRLWRPNGMSGKEIQFWRKHRSSMVKTYMHIRHKYL